MHMYLDNLLNFKFIKGQGHVGFFGFFLCVSYCAYLRTVLSFVCIIFSVVSVAGMHIDAWCSLFVAC